MVLISVYLGVKFLRYIFCEHIKLILVHKFYTFLLDLDTLSHIHLHLRFDFFDLSLKRSIAIQTLFYPRMPRSQFRLKVRLQMFFEPIYPISKDVGEIVYGLCNLFVFVYEQRLDLIDAGLLMDQPRQRATVVVQCVFIGLECQCAGQVSHRIFDIRKL